LARETFFYFLINIFSGGKILFFDIDFYFEKGVKVYRKKVADKIPITSIQLVTKAKLSDSNLNNTDLKGEGE
jgi:hypothetical protein